VHARSDFCDLISSFRRRRGALPFTDCTITAAAAGWLAGKSFSANQIHAMQTEKVISCINTYQIAPEEEM
jgi:hypothetical protein